MADESKPTVAVVIPNWNGKDTLAVCLDSLLKQTLPPEIIVVENASSDGSLELLENLYPQVTVLPQKKNLGFAGGVNAGISYALEQDFSYVALLNNDAVVDTQWAEKLVHSMEQHPKVGIVTSKFMSIDKQHLDSTGDIYTMWGLPYPRGRNEDVNNHYDRCVIVFGATGGASLYRSDMLRQIGLFDEDFFAYYEDVDISFRAQLAGWEVLYEPNAIAYHHIGATSSKIKGFTTYQTMKNLPWVLWKNVPGPLLIKVLPRFALAHSAFIFSAFVRGHGWFAVKGITASLLKMPKKLMERRKIQKNSLASVEYISSMLTWDLPPNATRLRKLRGKWWDITRTRKGRSDSYEAHCN